MKAFNLRGTNGSGKTYVARALIRLTSAVPAEYSGKKVLYYKGEFFPGKPFYILGSYETQCGGCDTIPSVQIVANLLNKFRDSGEDGIVFYEGLMISHMLGTVGATVKPWGADHMMAFLDTPLDTCIERIKARRLEKGNLKPFDPNRTVVKDYAAVQAAKKNAIRDGFQVVTVGYEQSIDSAIRLLEELHANGTGS